MKFNLVIINKFKSLRKTDFTFQTIKSNKKIDFN